MAWHAIWSDMIGGRLEGMGIVGSDVLCSEDMGAFVGPKGRDSAAAAEDICKAVMLEMMNLLNMHTIKHKMNYKSRGRSKKNITCRFRLTKQGRAV